MSWLAENSRFVLRRISALCAIVAFVAVSSRAQSGREAPLAGEQAAVRIEVVESSDELHESLQQKPALHFGAVRSPSLTITVDDTRKYQQMDGFGASLTDSSAWLLSHKLTDQQRKEALEKLFSPTKGIGLSVLRQPMGASDFAIDDYSYDDLPAGETDPDLKKFTIDRDRAYIIPILREALALNPKSENNRFAVESSGLDENFRLHDSGLVVAIGVHAAGEILRQICSIV